MGSDVRDTLVLCSSWAQSAESELNLTVPTDGLSISKITKSGMRRTWRAVINGQCNEEHVDSLVRCVRRIGEVIKHQSWRKELQAE